MQSYLYNDSEDYDRDFPDAGIYDEDDDIVIDDGPRPLSCLRI